jgi:hypothetical protein
MNYKGRMEAGYDEEMAKLKASLQKRLLTKKEKEALKTKEVGDG